MICMFSTLQINIQNTSLGIKEQGKSNSINVNYHSSIYIWFPFNDNYFVWDFCHNNALLFPTIFFGKFKTTTQFKYHTFKNQYMYKQWAQFRVLFYVNY